MRLLLRNTNRRSTNMALSSKIDRAERKPNALYLPTKYTEECKLQGYMSGVPYATYKAAGVMSKYDITKFARKTPFRYFNEEDTPQRRDNQVGTALRVLIFDEQNFEQKYMLLDEIEDRRKPEFKQAAKAIGADNVFVAKETRSMRGMKEAILTNDESRAALEMEGSNLSTCFFNHAETGVLLRAKFDKITEKEGFIIKPVKSVSRLDMPNLIFNASYHVEAAMCIDGHKAITGIELDAVKFIFVEDTFPYQVAVVYLDDISIEIGRRAYGAALAEYKEALDNKDSINNNEPSFMTGLPEWAMRDYEDIVI